MNPYSVLKRPVLSEKSNQVREDQDKYTFEVMIDASKVDVKKAVEMHFGVKVASVTTAITRNKVKRRGMYLAKTAKKTKKAIVTLKEGKIALFEDL